MKKWLVVLLALMLILSCASALASDPFAGMRVYEAGVHRVGVDIPAGEYVAIATGNYSGYFSVSSDPNGRNIIFNEIFEVNSIFTVQWGEYVELSRCIAVNATDFYGTYTIKSSNPGVMLKVGYDIAPGTYRLRATETKYNGYWCIYNSSRQDRIVDNGLFENSAWVSVSGGQYLVLTRCIIVD